MCGISGILGSNLPEDQRRVSQMLSVMKHRSPNGQYLENCTAAILGHGRLAVIDLHDRSNQPMSTADGRYTVVFNGAIYNYVELKSKLSSFYPFKGESDTEVLLAGFSVWGKDCLNELRGMFAFCIFDNLKKKAFMARDRFGQKPFYYTLMDKKLIFASEIKAILRFGFEPKPDFYAISDYLQNARYDHNEKTFFKGISQLRPGQYATWTADSGLVLDQYYDLYSAIKPTKCQYEDAVAQTRALMLETCNLHMRCDVPIGVSLSGGLDSSALLVCLTEGHNAGKHPGFFVDFGDDYSEKKWAKKVADKYSSSFHRASFQPTEFERWILPLIWHLEGPSGGLMNFALTKLMSLVNREGIVVLQDGTGLDEACGGYQFHHIHFLSDLKNSNDCRFEEALVNFSAHWDVTKEQANNMVKIISQKNNTNGRLAIDGTNMVKDHLLDQNFIANYAIDIDGLSYDANVCQSMIDFLQSSKVPRNNRMKDRTSMALGLELRAPFLDHIFVEGMLSLPTEYLFHGGEAKSVVREALSGWLDPFVAKAKKRSVHTPQGLWLRDGTVARFVEDLIHSESFASRKIFDIDKVKRVYSHYKGFGSENSFFVWQWINVEMWFRTFIDKDVNEGQSIAQVLDRW